MPLQNRINYDSCKVNGRLDATQEIDIFISKPESWDVPVIIQLFHGLCNQEISEFLTKKMQIFINELEDLP